MQQRKRRLPFKWSALRWAIAEWLTDLRLRTSQGRTWFREHLIDQSEQYSCTNLLREALHLDGDIIECGVYRGHSLLRMAMTLSLSNSAKTIYGLDSFDGFPADSVLERDVAPGRSHRRLRNKFQFVEHVPTRIRGICDILEFRNVELVPGFFEDTLPRFHDRRFCFVHLDCDIYSSYMSCLNFLYDRLVPGGIMVFDEYREDRWPGASQAIDEFFADKPEQPVCHGQFVLPKYHIRKSPSVAAPCGMKPDASGARNDEKQQRATGA